MRSVGKYSLKQPCTEMLLKSTYGYHMQLLPDDCIKSIQNCEFTALIHSLPVDTKFLKKYSIIV